MIKPRFTWQLPAPVDLDPELATAAADLGLSPTTARLLRDRGVTQPADLAAFFAPPATALADPRLLPDADRLLARLAQARAGRERVMVYGDFDADGLTGLAILVRALASYGLEVLPYVPSRLAEGHGLSLAAVETARAGGLSVIVTVDCGSTSHVEIAAAAGHGIDVLVTDHHHLPSELPAALAIVNPNRTDGRYPERRLSGAGVAFRVAELLLGGRPGGVEEARALADLALIGTVADVAPLVGENRAIAILGLDAINRAPRPGLAALLERAAIAAGSVTPETIAFAIAPRLNAPGRMGDAGDAVRLLLTDDAAEATACADALEAANLARRDVSRQVLAEARAQWGAGSEGRDGGGAPVDRGVAPGPGTPGDAAIIVRGPWPVGIAGPVAGRLAEETGRPAIVGAELGDVVRASCRAGGGGLHLAEALAACDDLLIRHGGHAGAAGFEIETGAWDAFRERFLVLAAATARPAGPPVLAVDLALPAAEIDYVLLAELARLEPTGPGNPEPLVAVLGLQVVRVRAANGGHTQLTLRRERDVLDGIAFGRDDLVGPLAEGDRVDVVARLVSRSFGGFESLQLEVRDLAPAGHFRPVADAALLVGPAAVPPGPAR